MSNQVYYHNFGNFRLDGGSMFGSVPKELWSKKIPADDKNRIQLATNALVIKNEERLILVDLGNGDKWESKFRDIYCIENNPFPAASEVSDIILTHLHFDHAGGISTYNPDKELVLTYPKATVYLQKDNYSNACKPNIKERASYLKENCAILDKASLELVDGSKELFPGVTVHKIDGHTVGQQYIEVKTAEEIYMFATDLIPTAHHLPLPYHLGYDICAITTIREKEQFLEKALLRDAVVVFQHDTDTVAGKIELDKKGNYALKSEVKIPKFSA